MKYTIVMEKGKESGYVAYAAALKGCVSQVENKKEEALKNIKEAMEAYIEAYSGKVLGDLCPEMLTWILLTGTRYSKTIPSFVSNEISYPV